MIIKTYVMKIIISKLDASSSAKAIDSGDTGEAYMLPSKWTSKWPEALCFLFPGIVSHSEDSRILPFCIIGRASSGRIVEKRKKQRRWIVDFVLLYSATLASRNVLHCKLSLLATCAQNLKLGTASKAVS